MIIRELDKDLREELKFIGSVIEEHPKNYQVWYEKFLLRSCSMFIYVYHVCFTSVGVVFESACKYSFTNICNVGFKNVRLQCCILFIATKYVELSSFNLLYHFM